MSRGSGMTRQEEVQMSILIPKGTAAAVLASLPIQLGLRGGAEMRDVVYGVVFLSIIMTAILIYFVERAPAFHTAEAPGPSSRASVSA